MKAGHTEEYVDGTSAAPWPQLDGVRPKTSPALVDDVRRSEDGEGRGWAKSNKSIKIYYHSPEGVTGAGLCCRTVLDTLSRTCDVRILP